MNEVLKKNKHNSIYTNVGIHAKKRTANEKQGLKWIEKHIWKK